MAAQFKENKTSQPRSKRELFGDWKKSTVGKTVIEWQLRHQRWMCPSCFLPLKEYHVHHLKPVSKIEEHESHLVTDGRNIVCLCPKCNLKQGSKIDTRFD